MFDVFYTFSNDEILRWIRDNYRLTSKSLIPGSFICCKCKRILIDPIQTDCGCRYCRACFSEYYEAGNRKCSNELECDNICLDQSITDDKAAARDILRMVIKCPFSNCAFYAEVKNVKDHMLKCEHIEDKCVLCGVYYSENEKKKHFEDECVKREVNCPKCQEKMSYEKLTSEHYNIESPRLCVKYESDCPNGCGLVILSEHRRVCEKNPMQCPFPSCREKHTVKTMPEHLANNNLQHFTEFVETIQVKDKEIEIIEEKVKSKFEEIRILKEKYEELLKLHRNIDKKLSSVQTSNSNNIGPVVKRVIFRKGAFVWKLDNIEQLRTTAESGVELSKFSDPFYTSEFGYKLCIKVYPAGDGVGAKSYMSVYFVVMKGEYDDLLLWPFRNKVTLSIHSPNKNLVENFKPDPMSACYQRPRDEYNIASGSPKFVKLDELNKFIIDGSIFIKMVVNAN